MDLLSLSPSPSPSSLPQLSLSTPASARMPAPYTSVEARSADDRCIGAHIMARPLVGRRDVVACSATRKGSWGRGGAPHIGHHFADDRCLWSEHPSGVHRRMGCWEIVVWRHPLRGALPQGEERTLSDKSDDRWLEAPLCIRPSVVTRPSGRGRGARRGSRRRAHRRQR